MSHLRRTKKFWRRLGWRKFLQAAAFAVVVLGLLMPKIVFAQFDVGNPAGEAAHNEAQKNPTPAATSTPAATPTPSGTAALSVKPVIDITDGTTGTGNAGAATVESDATAGPPSQCAPDARLTVDPCKKYKGFLGAGQFNPFNIRLKMCQAIQGLLQDVFGEAACSAAQAGVTEVEKTRVEAGKIPSWTGTVWNITRGIVSGAAIVILIFIGLANILHFNIDTYLIKKVLPRVIFAVIFANLSKVICALIIMFALALGDISSGGAGEVIVELLKTLPLLAILGIINMLSLVGLPIGLLALILVLMIVVGIVILGFLSLIQPFMMALLIGVAPLAIIAAALPATEGWFKKWLTMFFNWVFMFPVAWFLLWLMKYLPPLTEGFALFTPGEASNGPVNAPVFIAGLAARIILLIIAIRLPFKIGGDIAAGWAAVAKGAGSLGMVGIKTWAGSVDFNAAEKGTGWNKTKNKLKWAVLKRTPYLEPSMIAAGFKAKRELALGKAEAKMQTAGGIYQWARGPELTFLTEAKNKREEMKERGDPFEAEDKWRRAFQKIFGVEWQNATREQRRQAIDFMKTKDVKTKDDTMQWPEIYKRFNDKNAEALGALHGMGFYLRQFGQGGRFNPVNINSRTALRNLGLGEGPDADLGRTLLGSPVDIGRDETTYWAALKLWRRPSVGPDRDFEEVQQIGGRDNTEGEEQALFAKAISELIERSRMPEPEDTQGLIDAHPGVSDTTQLGVAMNKLIDSEKKLGQTIEEGGLGTDKVAQALTQVAKGRADRKCWQDEGTYDDYRRRYNENLMTKALQGVGLDDQQQNKFLTLAQEPGALSADDLTGLAPAVPRETIEQRILPAVREYQNSYLIEQGIAVNRGVNDLGNQGVNFNLVGTIARQTQQAVQEQPNPDEWLSQRSAALSRSVADLEKGAMPIESMERARQNLLADISAASPVVKYEDHDRLLMELKSAAHAIEGLRTNSQIREVASQPEGRASTAQLQSLYRERAGDIYREKMQSPMRRT